MGRARLLHSNLTGGEFSAAMRARSDLERWFAAAEKVQNFIPRITGGAMSRPGFAHLGAPKFADKICKLVRFSKSSFSQIQLEFGDFYVRFWDVATQTQISVSGAPYELVTDFGENDLAGLRWWQEGDVLFVANISSGFHLKRLKRLADNNWVYGDYEYREGPWRPEGEAKLSLTPSSDTGTGISLTTSGSFFDGLHVGALIRVRQNTGAPPFQKWLQKESYTAGQKVLNAGRVYQAGSSATSGTNSPIHTEGTVSDGVIDWTFIHDGAGVAQITAVTDASHATADVLVRLPISGVATKQWSEGAFSDFRGHPRTGVIHQERFGLFGLSAQPDTVFLSVAGDFDADGSSFKPGLGTGLITDEDAVTRTLADGQVEPIVFALSREVLYLGTTGDIKRVGGPSRDEPITPAGAQANTALSPGASPNCVPAVTPTALFYATRDGHRLRELRFDDATRNDVTILAEHVGASPFVDLQWSENPDRILWALTADGALKSMTYDPAQGVAAWAQHALGGAYVGAAPVLESISSCFGAFDRDEIWAVVKRTVNGATARSIERMTRPFDSARMSPDLACLVDNAGFFDAWNADAAKTMTLTLDAGMSGAAGDTAVLSATGHTPFGSGAVGREVHLRRLSLPARADDAPGPVRLLVTASADSASASVKLLSDAPAGLTATALAQWAFASAVMTALDWLDGETVMVNGDGGGYGPFTVLGGQITLPDKIARAWIGLGYSRRICTLPLEVAGSLGSARGVKGRIDEVTVLVRDALSGFVRAAGGSHSEALSPRLASDVTGRAPAPQTRDVAVRFPASWDRERQIEVGTDDPLPFTVLGWSARVIAND